MKYRPYKRDLADSMAEMVEVDGRVGLIRHLRKELSPYPEWDHFSDAAVREQPYYGDDPATGWRDVHIVTIDGYGVVGFIEGPIPISAQFF